MSEAPLTRKQRQAETRRRLLAAAARVFTARGYHGASVAEIARAAGFTTGALYANFAAKEELFIALIDQHLAGQHAEVDTIAAGADAEQIRQSLRARVEHLMTGLVAQPDVSAPAEKGEALTTIQVQTLTLEFTLYAVRERPDLRQAIAERYRAVDTLVARTIRAWLQAEGNGHPIDADELAIAQSWLIEGLGLRLLMDPDLISPARAADLYRLLVADLPLGGAPSEESVGEA